MAQKEESALSVWLKLGGMLVVLALVGLAAMWLARKAHGG